jgi:iron-sulfur cluster assembly protein
MSIRAKFKVITLTEAAADRVRALMARSGELGGGLRIGVKKGGCAGMEYTMEFAAAPNPHDEIVEDNGARVLIEPGAIMFLLGTQMDYRVDKLSAGFVFNNPNQTSACGCGESVALTPASEMA